MRPFEVEGRLDRKALPLLLASKVADAAGELYPLDRIRMQKAVFLLVQRGSTTWRELYDYRPYAWGPYSSGLTADLTSMSTQRLIQVEDVPGSRYGRYRTTLEGEAVACADWEALAEHERVFITTVRAYVTSRSFTQLLREVYAEYPDFARASLFSG